VIVALREELTKNPYFIIQQASTFRSSS